MPPAADLSAGFGVFGSAPVRGVLTLCVLALTAEAVPALEPLRVLSARATTESTDPFRLDVEPGLGEAELPAQVESSTFEETPAARGATRGPIAGPTVEDGRLVPIDAEKPPLPIEDPSGKGLAGFFAALELTQKKAHGAVTRILHFGDSIVVSDYVSSTLRRNLQRQFGDAGHGFVLMANAWPAYAHRDVERSASSGFRASRVVGPYIEDGMYGLGGVTFRAPEGVRATFGTVASGDFGRRVSRFELAYLVEPGGGTLALRLDGGAPRAVSTDGPERRSAFFSLETPDGPHELEVTTLDGTARTFGVVLERDAPGVVLDALGIQGARIRFLDKQDDAHWAEQLKARKPNLFIYQFGANESSDGFLFPMAEYLSTMHAVLEQGLKAVPNAGCLVIGAMDRAVKRGDELMSFRVIPELVEQQRRAATAAGCSFFDTYAAMGGRGSMATWVRRGLGQTDFTHPTGAGAQAIGNWIYRALMDAYDRYLKQGAEAHRG